MIALFQASIGSQKYDLAYVRWMDVAERSGLFPKEMTELIWTPKAKAQKKGKKKRTQKAKAQKGKEKENPVADNRFEVIPAESVLERSPVEHTDSLLWKDAKSFVVNHFITM